MTVKRHWFGDSGIRLDASYHLSEGLITMRKLKKCPYPISLLKDETENIFKGGIFRRTYVDSIENGYEFITASEMMKSDISGGKFISKKYSDIDHLFVNNGWTLVSRSGTLGNTVYTSDIFKGKVLTDDLIRIVPNNKNVLSGYLYAFLTSHYGYGLLTQSGYGGVIQHIEPHHIENIPIPILPEETQQKIHNLIVESAQLRVEANKLLKEAVEIFEKEIGESKVTHSYQVGKVSSNKIYGFHKRFDSQYQLGWKALDKEKKNNLKYTNLAQVATNIFVGGRGKRNYVENGIPFLSSSDMMLFNPKRNSKKISTSTQGIENMKVSFYDILISRSGTVGNTVIVGEDLQGTVISEHALRLVVNPEKISPLYVFTFLKTKYGLKTMESSSFGSVIITLNEDLIGNIEMPILDDHLQSDIERRTEKYISNLDQSTELENQAIDLIEKEIDQWQQL